MEPDAAIATASRVPGTSDVLCPCQLQARRGLLEGAMRAGAALRAGMGLGHAIAQELGGRYGLPHGTMNTVSLPAALRFNSTVAASELARFGEAIGRGDPVARVSELAALAGPSRLRDYQVPREDLPELAQAIAERPAAKANPRPGPPDAVLELPRRCGDQNRSQMGEQHTDSPTHAAPGGAN